MASPRPEPTRLKLLKGNPGKRPINKNEPQPRISDSLPKPPRELGKVAKKEWKRISKELYAIGLLTTIDTSALAAYCNAYEIWVDASSKFRKSGILIKTPNGYPVQNPLFSIMNRASEEMHRWGKEFGLTPASRVNLRADKKETEDDPAKIFLEKSQKLRLVKG